MELVIKKIEVKKIFNCESRLKRKWRFSHAGVTGPDNIEDKTNSQLYHTDWVVTNN